MGTARMFSIVYTLLQLLEDLMKNCFLNKGGINIGGRGIKCIRFADYMALLAEEEIILNSMMMEPNDRCEKCEIKISKPKTMVIGRKPKKTDSRIKDESLEQVGSFKYLG